MLTPAFEIQQDEVFITLLIKAPYARVSDTEIFIEENEFRFHSKPYFLRLTLPGNIVEDGREEAKYDTDNGFYTVKVPKEVKGEMFEGLDMITKLLTPKGKGKVNPPLIEVISETTNEEQQEGEAGEEEDYDWHVDQVPFTEEKVLLGEQCYGFANQKSGVFTRLQDEVVEIVDLKDPDHCSMSDRREKRMAAENNKFDEDHYIADLYDDSVIQDLISYCPDYIGSLSDEDKELMRNLPKKEYIIENKVSVFLGLVDILFAYCYDMRTTEGEHNVESCWTLSKLSSTLSWLDSFSSIEETLTACYRRCLSYPLYRNWQLLEKIQHDTACVFSGGRQNTLKCLLDIHRCFSASYPHYLLNDLYITDYCVWIQNIEEKQLQSLSEAIKQFSIKKSDVGLDLNSIESNAINVLEDDQVNDLAKDVSQVKLSHDSDDSSTDSSETCTDSDDESTCSVTSSTNSADEEDNEILQTLKSANDDFSDTCVQIQKETSKDCEVNSNESL